MYKKKQVHKQDAIQLDDVIRYNIFPKKEWF